MGSTSSASNDLLDFCGYSISGNTGIKLTTRQTTTDGAVAEFSDAALGSGLGTPLFGFKNFTNLILTSGNDEVRLDASSDPNLKVISADNGNDTVDVESIINTTIDLGAGSDWLKKAGSGTSVYAGDDSDVDTFSINHNVRIIGAETNDQVLLFGILKLHGSLKYFGQESGWIWSWNGTQYGINTDGDLVIRDILGNMMFVANYHGGPDYSFCRSSLRIPTSSFRHASCPLFGASLRTPKTIA